MRLAAFQGLSAKGYKIFRLRGKIFPVVTIYNYWFYIKSKKLDEIFALNRKNFPFLENPVGHCALALFRPSPIMRI